MINPFMSQFNQFLWFPKGGLVSKKNPRAFVVCRFFDAGNKSLCHRKTIPGTLGNMISCLDDDSKWQYELFTLIFGLS